MIYFNGLLTACFVFLFFNTGLLCQSAGIVDFQEKVMIFRNPGLEPVIEDAKWMGNISVAHLPALASSSGSEAAHLGAGYYWQFAQSDEMNFFTKIRAEKNSIDPVNHFNLGIGAGLSHKLGESFRIGFGINVGLDNWLVKTDNPDFRPWDPGDPLLTTGRMGNTSTRIILGTGLSLHYEQELKRSGRNFKENSKSLLAFVGLALPDLRPCSGALGCNRFTNPDSGSTYTFGRRPWADQARLDAGVYYIADNRQHGLRLFWRAGQPRNYFGGLATYTPKLTFLQELKIFMQLHGGVMLTSQSYQVGLSFIYATDTNMKFRVSLFCHFAPPGQPAATNEQLFTTSVFQNRE